MFPARRQGPSVKLYLQSKIIRFGKPHVIEKNCFRREMRCDHLCTVQPYLTSIGLLHIARTASSRSHYLLFLCYPLKLLLLQLKLFTLCDNVVIDKRAWYLSDRRYHCTLRLLIWIRVLLSTDRFFFRRAPFSGMLPRCSIVRTVSALLVVFSAVDTEPIRSTPRSRHQRPRGCMEQDAKRKLNRAYL